MPERIPPVVINRHNIWNSILLICFIFWIILLTGCQLSQTNSSGNYGAASSVAVTRHTQYQLWDKGTYSTTPAVTSSSSAISANSDNISFDWDGDAIALLAELARQRSLQFNYSGVRLPLPVSLHVRNTTYSNVLRLIEAQTAWRATIFQYPGLLQVNFMTPEKVKK
ncbi:hypothetical protein EL09_22660 [Salmonella enterica subsp. enterica]|nr:DotD/TraH family lipoprotein [Salmonella enterica subsp. enterica]MIF52470.1 hypothetical protein [Salmonella enterica subsp. enterica]